MKALDEWCEGFRKGMEAVNWTDLPEPLEKLRLIVENRGGETKLNPNVFLMPEQRKARVDAVADAILRFHLITTNSDKI